MAARNYSIDAFRVIANVAVIVIHTAPFLAVVFPPGVRLCGEMLNQSARFAVPFFFLAAGYFFAVSVGNGAAPLPLALKLVRRLGGFFLFWSSVYVLLPIGQYAKDPELGYGHAVQVLAGRVVSLHFLINGTEIHLWFLPALGCSLLLLGAACQLGLERALLLLGAAMYLFGLITGAYATTPLGWDLGLNPRNGPIYGTVFVVSGYLMQRWGVRTTVQRAVTLLATGAVLRLTELSWICGKYGRPPSQIDYVLGTYPFSIGIFMLLLSTTGLGDVRGMRRLSRYSAGVYCAHILMVNAVKVAVPVLGDPLWEIARPPVVFVLTFALVMGLARVRYLRPVLM